MKNNKQKENNIADVNDVFSKVTSEKSYFDPTKESIKPKWYPYRKGDYLGHITGVESIIVDVKKDGNYRARLYTYTITVAPENKIFSYEFSTKEGEKYIKDGSVYEGKELKGKLWRFLEPQEGDEFESHSGGNKTYMRFCETIGVEVVTEKKEVDGKEVELKMLPNLSIEDMINKPVCAFVDKGRQYKNKKGETRNFYDVKFIKEWKDGKEIEGKKGKTDAIPF